MNLKSILLVSALSLVGAANADLLSLYNFNDASTSGTNAANAALLLTADGGTLQTTTSLTTNAAIANVVSFSGTITNAANSDPAGAALAIQGGGTGSGATYVAANNGSTLTLTTTALPGSTLSALNLSFAGQATATGFTSLQLATSVNGGAFVNFGSTFSLASSTTPGFGNATTNVPTAIQALDLSSLGSNISTVSLQLTLSGAIATAGNIRLDNLQLNGTTTQAVPEPATMAALGLGALGLLRRRRSAK